MFRRRECNREMYGNYAAEFTYVGYLLGTCAYTINTLKPSVAHIYKKISSDRKSLDSSATFKIQAYNSNINALNSLIERINNAGAEINKLIDLHNTKKSVYVPEKFNTEIKILMVIAKKISDFNVENEDFFDLNFQLRNLENNLFRYCNYPLVERYMEDCNVLSSVQDKIKEDALVQIKPRMKNLDFLFNSAMVLLASTAFLLSIFVHPGIGISVAFLVFVSSCFYAHYSCGPLSKIKESYICKQRERLLTESDLQPTLTKFPTPIFAGEIENYEHEDNDDNDLSSTLQTAI